MFARFLTCVILSLAPVFAFAQSAERSLSMDVEAIVLSINPETREIVLGNETGGRSESIMAGPEVINFDQIKVGDHVKTVYTLGIAARMAMPGEMDNAVEINATANEGEKPRALATTAVTAVLEFLFFDADTSLATVKDSNGNERRIEVETEAGRTFVADLKAGDMVSLTFNESLAVGIAE